MFIQVHSKYCKIPELIPSACEFIQHAWNHTLCKADYTNKWKSVYFCKPFELIPIYKLIYLWLQIRISVTSLKDDLHRSLRC